ncbi:MAG: DUF2312 domain-containing protein [Pseudomonadota bacterium]
MKPDPDFDRATATAVSAPSALVAAKELTAFVERIERLEEKKAEIADGVKSVYAEAKARGFDMKTLSRVIALRKKSLEERQEDATMLDL